MSIFSSSSRKDDAAGLGLGLLGAIGIAALLYLTVYHLLLVAVVVVPLATLYLLWAVVYAIRNR
jgi:hypothetical protein